MANNNVTDVKPRKSKNEGYPKDTTRDNYYRVFGKNPPKGENLDETLDRLVQSSQCQFTTILSLKETIDSAIQLINLQSETIREVKKDFDDLRTKYENPAETSVALPNQADDPIDVTSKWVLGRRFPEDANRWFVAMNIMNYCIGLNFDSDYDEDDDPLPDWLTDSGDKETVNTAKVLTQTLHRVLLDSGAERRYGEDKYKAAFTKAMSSNLINGKTTKRRIFDFIVLLGYYSFCNLNVQNIRERDIWKAITLLCFGFDFPTPWTRSNLSVYLKKYFNHAAEYYFSELINVVYQWIERVCPCDRHAHIVTTSVYHTNPRVLSFEDFRDLFERNPRYGVANKQTLMSSYFRTIVSVVYACMFNYYTPWMMETIMEEEHYQVESKPRWNVQNVFTEAEQEFMRARITQNSPSQGYDPELFARLQRAIFISAEYKKLFCPCSYHSSNDKRLEACNTLYDYGIASLEELKYLK